MARKKPFLYLASASPRRREILRKIKIPFKRIVSTYEEKNNSSANPKKLVLRHACQKALHAKAPKPGLILGADTIVWCKGKVLGKPKSMKEAEKMLCLISGREHRVFTGIALLDTATGKIKSRAVSTRVRIKKMTLPEIRNYFTKVDPLDKAGAYAIQMKPQIVERIKGSYSNVVGLPVEALLKMLKI